MKKNMFYHASDIGNLTELIPLSNLKDRNEKVCYFTPVRAYALFYLRDKEINHVTCGVSDKGIVIYHEQFSNQLKMIYQGRSGYIYACRSDDNLTIAHTNGVWTAAQPVAVAAVEYINDVFVDILDAEKAGEVQINRYELLSDEEKRENVNIIKNYIIKSGFLTAGTAKARFFAENCPQSWKEAELEIHD